MKRLINVLCISILFSGFPISGMDSPSDGGKGKERVREDIPTIRVSDGPTFTEAQSLDELIMLKGWKTNKTGHFLDAISDNIFSNLPKKVKSKLNKFKYGRGTTPPFYHVIILQGEPGVGKTSCGFAIGKFLGVRTIKVPATHLYDSFKSSASDFFPHLIKLAKQESEHIILIIDEFDALTNQHKNEHNHDTGIIESLDDEIDGLDDSNVFLILTTNGIEDYPPKFHDRYNNNTITLFKPSREQRKYAIEIYKTKCSLNAKISEAEWNEFLLNLTESFNFREIRHLFDTAHDLACDASTDSSDLPRTDVVITKENFKKAAKEIISNRQSKIMKRLRRTSKFWKEHQSMIAGGLTIIGLGLTATGVIIATSHLGVNYWQGLENAKRHAESLAHQLDLSRRAQWIGPAVRKMSFTYAGNLLPYGLGSVYKEKALIRAEEKALEMAFSVESADLLPDTSSLSVPAETAECDYYLGAGVVLGGALGIVAWLLTGGK